MKTNRLCYLYNHDIGYTRTNQALLIFKKKMRPIFLTVSLVNIYGRGLCNATPQTWVWSRLIKKPLDMHPTFIQIILKGKKKICPEGFAAPCIFEYQQCLLICRVSRQSLYKSYPHTD